MPDYDDGPLDAVERLQRRSGTLGVVTEAVCEISSGERTLAQPGGVTPVAEEDEQERVDRVGAFEAE